MSSTPDTPKPDTGCTSCAYEWVKRNGTWQWVPSWKSGCTVHLRPSDLL